jgi:saccharopine dehydrogenase-like NADP-dependent oxidoreductase
MVSVLIVGAGKSSTYLIDTLLKNTSRRSSAWKVTVADSDEKTLKYKTRNYPNAEIAVLDINNEGQRQKLVRQADIVVSLMPPHLHILLAKDCLQFKKNLITSSYASEEMRLLDAKAKEAGLMFMCEMGLDPGIDHMTASFIFDSVRKVVSEIASFKSYCGGLVAPESDTNPWHYKFSWNPRNIINAGKDGAHYLKNGQKIHVAYDQIFAHNDTVYCAGAGNLAYYANRDSLSYIDLYHLHEAKDFMRATLRHPDFSKGWDALIKLGITNTEHVFDTTHLSYKAWMQALIGYDNTALSVPDFAWQKCNISDPKIQQMIQWLDIFGDQLINAGPKTSGDILLDILMDKWSMAPEDKDMVVMLHEIKYKHRGMTNKLVSSMVVLGENSDFSAMAKTVGLPMAILTDLIVNKQIKVPHGVLIPTMPEVYRPVLKRLAKYDIEFAEHVMTEN